MRLLSVLLTSCVWASSAHALSGGGGYSLERGWFSQADFDNDQQITSDEAKRLSNFNLSSPEVFAKYDTSGEGVIIFPEFLDYLRTRRPNE